MDRNREGRRTAMAVTNSLSRRRHRSSSLRDSPEEDGPVELQETARLRDRGGIAKKDRDRDREQDRDRLGRSKRRRADRLMHGSNREDGGEDSSEESVNDEEDDEEDDDGGGSVRMHHTTTTTNSSSLSHRKSFPPASKSLRTAPPPATWKSADEMIGVAIPRKARSASTKRSHECWTPGGVIVAEPNHRQASTSPVRPNLITGASYHAPTSPSSNASVRKKLKPNGPKLRPPKSSSKASSSAQDEMIEFEIAEVLYGLQRQPQGPSSSSAKQEVSANDSIKFDSRELNNRSATDAKSRVSSPISNSSSALAPSPSTILPHGNNNINPASSSVSTLSAVAPKRKRPRPIKYEEDNNSSILSVRNGSISSTTKIETDLPSEMEIAAPNLEKNQGSGGRNGGVSNDSGNSQVVPGSSEVQQESVKPESKTLSDLKPLTEESVGHDLGSSKEEPKSPKDENLKSMIATKANTAMSEVENQREEKFQIDLMAPPPLRSSPERDNEIDFVAVVPKVTVADAEMEIKATTKDDGKSVKNYKGEALNVESKVTAEESDSISKKAIFSNRESNIDLHLDLEKTDRNIQRQQQPHLTSEKSAQTASLPLPMSVAAWPSGIPPMGYVTPLPGVVSMDGNGLSSGPLQPPNVIFPQPRPKRCATHCYIARNICYHQQISRMNPFWPAAAGSASLYGAAAAAKHCNFNVVSSADLHGGHIAGRGAANSSQGRGQSLSLLPGHNTEKDKVPQGVGSNIADAAQRKHILLQQPLPPGAGPSNILHGPAFLFPISQQQVGPAAASARSGSVKPPATSGPTASSTSTSVPVGPSGTAAIAAPTMSFNYPNMPGNEAQYLAILQNSGYPFPIPAHVGAPPTYRGTPHGQAMPFFSGSFYPSQVLHPSQLQQQHHQQQLPSTQSHPQQNASTASSSSSSQKQQQQPHQQHQHLQNYNHNHQHQPRAHSGGGSLQGGGFPTATQNQPPQQRQQAPNHQIEIGMEHGPSSHGDNNRVSRANMSVYGQNFAMPIHPPPHNFALMTPPSTGANAGGASGGHGEKKQQQGSKAGGEQQASQAFALSFASINGASTTPGLDLSSISPNHPIFQNLPEVTRHGYHQIMASAVAVQQQAATAAAHQQKKNFTISEEGKTVGAGNGNGNGDAANNNNHNIEEDRKAATISMKTPQIVGQSIAFSRADLPDSAVSTIAGDTVVDSSARTLNLSGSSRNPGTGNPSSSQQQQQQFQMNKQQQHLIRLQKQQQQQQFSSSPTVRNNKTPTSNGSVYSDHHLPSSSNSSMAAKFPNALSSFSHQTLVQSNSNNSPVQSPQWKNSVRTISQIPSTPSSSSMKNHLPQQHPGHTQISFAAAANPKSSSSATQSQGQLPLPSSNQSPSPPMMVGSPTTSSMSKSASGSPRTTSASTSTGQHKVPHASSLSSSSQQNKNSPLSEQPNRKSSPVDGRNGPSILGNPAGTKLQLPQQQQQKQQQQHQQHQKQQQQQLSKQTLQQTQLFFSQPYVQVQASHSTGPTTNAVAASGYYLQRQQQQPQGLSGTSSSGMLSLCPVSLSSTAMMDPAKAVATATAAAKGGGGFPTQTTLHPTQFAAGKSSGNPHQFVPANFPYVHAVSAVVPMKPTEQKQPAGE